MEFNDPIHQRRRRIFSLIKFDLTASNVLIPGKTVKPDISAGND